MKYELLLQLILSLVSTNFWGQNIYYSRDGKVSFFSEAPLENIEAHNSRGASVIDFESCKFEFSVLIKGFMFEKSLMQEHFNENYMESDKYPRAVFTGQIKDCRGIDLHQEGTYSFTTIGEMEIRGQKKIIEADGAFVVKNGKINAKSAFELVLDDFDIAVPSLVRDNIAKLIEVKVEADFKLLNK